MVINNKDLRAAFDYYNKVYFGGELPYVADLQFTKKFLYKKESLDGEQGKYDDGRYFIHIHEDFKRHPDAGVIILIHEMIHLYLRTKYNTDPPHGDMFSYEKVRLFNAGAYEELL